MAQKRKDIVLTPGQFITENYEHLRFSAKRISGGHELADESLHYAMEEFLLKKNAQDIVDSGGGVFYIVSILLRCWRSKTSPFYRKYLNYDNGLPEEVKEMPMTVDDRHKQHEVAETALSKLHWYDKMLWQTYVEEGHSISSLAKVTGIPRTSISLTINRVRRYLKKEIKRLYE